MKLTHGITRDQVHRWIAYLSTCEIVELKDGRQVKVPSGSLSLSEKVREQAKARAKNEPKN